MNERIKELVEQASSGACYDEPGAVTLYNDEIKKFAELIVRECAEICLEANDHKNILQHFGVEE